MPGKFKVIFILLVFNHYLAIVDTSQFVKASNNIPSDFTFILSYMILGYDLFTDVIYTNHSCSNLCHSRQIHLSNILLYGIDTQVANSIMPAANTKDSLYQSLPPNIKLALRSKLPSFHVVEEVWLTADAFYYYHFC